MAASSYRGAAPLLVLLILILMLLFAYFDLSPYHSKWSLQVTGQEQGFLSGYQLQQYDGGGGDGDGDGGSSALSMRTSRHEATTSGAVTTAATTASLATNTARNGKSWQRGINNLIYSTNHQGAPAISDIPVSVDEYKGRESSSSSSNLLVADSAPAIPGKQLHALRQSPSNKGRMIVDKFVNNAAKQPQANSGGGVTNIKAAKQGDSKASKQPHQQQEQQQQQQQEQSSNSKPISTNTYSNSADLANPLHPRVPFCSNAHDASPNPNLNSTLMSSSSLSSPVKQTKAKAYVCAMFRDEEGFLAEFVAFYKVLGVDHIILFDHFSADFYLKEVIGWVNEGFLTIRNASELEHNNTEIRGNDQNYWRVIAMKRRAERLCMEWGIEHGFDYHISVDLDEYMFPSHTDDTSRHPNLSLVDAIDKWFSQYPDKAVMMVPKTNFNPSPHLLEPIDLLTIEAYLLKYEQTGFINFHMSVQPKVVYRIGGGTRLNYTAVHPVLLHCCAFHGCEARKRRPYSNDYDCWASIKEFDEKNSSSYSYSSSSIFNYDRYSRQFIKYSEGRGEVRINHYARSLEKHYMKGRTWMTASQTNNQYDLLSYFHRTFGWTFDDSALRYSCAVRKEIENKWGNKRGEGTKPFLRPGDSWYRNPEVGRSIEIPEKRGRGNGRASVRTPFNPLHYEQVQKKSHSATSS